MSKKLIAVAAAAALALSALVAAPASANAITLAIQAGPAGDGTTSALATAINVPSGNTVGVSEAGNTTATAIRYTASAAAGTSINISVTGAAKLLTVAQFDAAAPDEATSATGATSLTGIATGGSYVFYVTTTSTAVSTLVLESSTSKLTRYVKGIAGLAYTVTAVGPQFVQTAVPADLVVKAVDLFGNAVSIGGGQISVTYLGNVSEQTTATAYRSATKDAVTKVQGTATGGQAAMTVTIASDLQAAANIAGFPNRSFTTFLTVNNVNPVVSLAALEAQVAALTAQMAGMRTKALSVTKKKYNTLARKWNASNPSARVALKK